MEMQTWLFIDAVPEYDTSQNGQTHFKNLAGNAARFLKFIWPFWDIMQTWNIGLKWVNDSRDKKI